MKLFDSRYMRGRERAEGVLAASSPLNFVKNGNIVAMFDSVKCKYVGL